MKKNLQNLLATPFDHPPLENSVFPGDRVMLVPDRFMVKYPGLLARIATLLVRYGVSPHEIGVILKEKEYDKMAENIRKHLPGKFSKEVVIDIHRPDVRERLAMLGVDNNDSPIMLAKPIVDADFVMTIGRIRPRKTIGYFGVHSALYPRFSDLETQGRFAAESSNPHSRGERYMYLNRQCDAVAELLGLGFTTQLILDNSGKPSRLLAGKPTSVLKECLIQG